MLLRDAITTDAATTLADYTRPSLIAPGLEGQDMAGAVKELSRLLHQEGCVPDMLQFYHAVLNREFLINTAMDFGVAVPHARLEGTSDLRFSLGRSPIPMVWGAKGSQAVEWIFLVAVPSTDAAGYLHFLSGLAKFGRYPQVRAQLQAAHTAEELFAVLQQVRVRQA